jgi:squalene-hopene/tetraprenyl-beta-curcumene cyclase
VVKRTTAALLIFSGWAIAMSAVAARPAAPDTPENNVSWDHKAAEAYMDGRIAWWMTWPSAQRDHDTFCVSCHTALPYALARPALRISLNEATPSPTETRLLANVVKRVRMWNDVAPFYPDQRNGLPKTSESRGAESILNALILASRDAEDGGLTADAKIAFANLWALQMKTGDLSGAWAWLNFKYEPWEAPGSPYFGASLAAIAVGTAPDGYASGPEIQDNIKGLRTYLTKQFEQQHLLNRMMVLWASTKLPGVLTADQRDGIVAAILAAQQTDGGWATAALGPWQRVDGTPLETGTDGYATGLATFVLEQVPSAPTAPQIQRGLQWLRTHQDKDTGRWSAFSLNKKRDPASDAGQFMNDAATAYAVLALAASH